MRHIGTLLCAAAALSTIAAPAVQAKDEKVPPEVAAKRSGKAPQASPSPLEMVFAPMTPCRVFYTPAAVAAGGSATFRITGSGDFRAQGGPVAGCGIPASAKAVSISLSAVNPSSNGSFKAFAAGTALPPTTVLNYRAGINETGGATVRLSPGGQLSVHTTSTARIIGDVTGYYAPQMWAYVSQSGVIQDQGGRAVSATRAALGYFQVFFDRNVQSCVGTASADLGAYTISVHTYQNYAGVYIYNKDGERVDTWFNIALKC